MGRYHSPGHVPATPPLLGPLDVAQSPLPTTSPRTSSDQGERGLTEQASELVTRIRLSELGSFPANGRKCCGFVVSKREKACCSCL